MSHNFSCSPQGGNYHSKTPTCCIGKTILGGEYDINPSTCTYVTIVRTFQLGLPKMIVTPPPLILFCYLMIKKYKLIWTQTRLEYQLFVLLW